MQEYMGNTAGWAVSNVKKNINEMLQIMSRGEEGVVKKNLSELFHLKRAWLHANYALFILGLLSS